VVVVGDYYYSNNAGALFIYQLVGDEYDLIDTVIGDKAGDKVGVVVEYTTMDIFSSSFPRAK